MENINISDVGDQIGNLSENMMKYGITTVIMAAGIILFIIIVLLVFRSSQKHTKNILDQNQKMINSFMEQNKNLMSTIIGELQNNDKVLANLPMTKNDEDKKTLVSTYIDINLGLKNICRSILDKLDCDRVAIYVFHNGNKSIHGLPFFKMSCIGEWVNRSNASRGKLHTDLPLYLFSDIIEGLYEKGIYTCRDIQNSPSSQQVLEFINHGNVASLAILPINDEDGNLAGFTAVEYRTLQPEDKSILKSITTLVEDENKTIGGIIIDSEIKDKINNSSKG